MPEYYFQCRMKKLREGEGGMDYHVAWIPERLAKVEQVVKIKLDGEWSKGWKVSDVWGERRTPEEIRIAAKNAT